MELAQLKYRSQPSAGGRGSVLSPSGRRHRHPGPRRDASWRSTAAASGGRITDLQPGSCGEMEKPPRPPPPEPGKRRRARVVALVGYTNAGKSTLFNRLTGADVLRARIKLFATLDSVSRPVEPAPRHQQRLLVDTVGFIRKLPHEVVEAFHATLEEARLADVLVLVSDGADPQLLSRRHTVGEVLDSLGAVDAPRIDALNKCDLLSPSADVLPGALPISAATGQGLDELLTAIEDALDAGTEEVSLLVPFARYALTDKLRRLGSVLSQEHTAEGVVLRWRAEKANVDYALREGAVLLETERK